DPPGRDGRGDRDGADDHHRRRRARDRALLAERRVIATRFNKFTTYVVLVAFAFAALYPLISIIFLPFHRKNDLVTGFSLPSTFSLQTFIDAWNQGSFGQGMWGSALVAVSVTVVSAAFSLLTGYAFGTMRFRGSTVLFNLIVLGLIFPYEATVI